MTITVKVFRTNKTNDDQCQDDFDEHIAWSTHWLLTFHSDKCKIMHLRNQNYTQYKAAAPIGRRNFAPTGTQDLTMYTIIPLKSVCRNSQNVGPNSCSIVSGDVSNCSYREKVLTLTSSYLSSVSQFFYTRKQPKTTAKSESRACFR